MYINSPLAIVITASFRKDFNCTIILAVLYAYGNGCKYICYHKSNSRQAHAFMDNLIGDIVS